jgi:hypothetical protein
MQRDLQQLGAGRRHRRMFEVVVSAYCPLVGKSVQSAKSQCWGLYNAVICDLHLSREWPSDSGNNSTRHFSHLYSSHLSHPSPLFSSEGRGKEGVADAEQKGLTLLGSFFRSYPSKQ